MYEYARLPLDDLSDRFGAYREKIKWKQHELDIIRNNYKTMSDQEIQEKLLPHRGLFGVTNKRQKMGLHKRAKLQKHQIWTPEEVKLLKDNYLKYDQRELQAKFFPNKTVEQVRSAKMSRVLKKPPVWTNEERELLVDHGADYSSADLRKMFFKNKTNNQIAWMRKHLGVFRNKK